MSHILTDLSTALAGITEGAGPHVVRVEARRRVPASGIIWSAEGTIVTAHHVIEWDEGIKIGLPSGETVRATLVGRDPSTDLAVLQADAHGLAGAPWGDLSALRVGHLVLALGRPGRSARVTLGVVSALGDSWRTPAGGELDRYLQSDVVMYPGFSGGPLVDAEGRFLGLNTTALLWGGTSLTVPPATVSRVVGTLLAHGRVRRGYLGIGLQPVELVPPLRERAGEDAGLLVVSVQPDSPAERAGLLLGDTLVRLDGKPVRDADHLASLLTEERIGAAMPIRILRAGEARELTVVVGDRG